jgi:hypothetical protein
LSSTGVDLSKLLFNAGRMEQIMRRVEQDPLIDVASEQRADFGRIGRLQESARDP